MAADKDLIISDVQAIVNIVAGTASLLQEFQTVVFTKCLCSSCNAIYWKLTESKEKYLQLYPYCPRCGSKRCLNDITEDPEVIGAEVFFLCKNGRAYASFKITQQALNTPNIKRMLETCDARFIT